VAPRIRVTGELGGLYVDGYATGGGAGFAGAASCAGGAAAQATRNMQTPGAIDRIVHARSNSATTLFSFIDVPPLTRWERVATQPDLRRTVASFSSCAARPNGTRKYQDTRLPREC
jgi:hypothetical protein